MRNRLPHGLGGRCHWIEMSGAVVGNVNVKREMKRVQLQPMRSAERCLLGGPIVILCDWITMTGDVEPETIE